MLDTADAPRVFVAYDVAIAVTHHVLVRAYEEPVLRRTFGAEYDAFCARVPRWPGCR